MQGDDGTQYEPTLHTYGVVLQDAVPSAVKVTGFTSDGGDPTGKASEANTKLLLKYRRAIINRAPQ